jgi:hypothetical protein
LRANVANFFRNAAPEVSFHSPLSGDYAEPLESSCMRRRNRLSAVSQIVVVLGGCLMLQGCLVGAVVGGTAAVVGGTAKATGAVVGAGFDAVTTSDEETRARREREQREWEREQRRCEQRQRQGKSCYGAL